MAWDFNGAGEVLLVDKPATWTSFDVVRKVRNLFHIRKIGHGGTLDPSATGLLILCTGPRTKQLADIIGSAKEYTGTMRLGIVTPSFDLETEVSETRPWDDVTPEQVDAALRSFVGTREQVPPMYSAVKHRGRALYKYAREGKQVDRPARQVEITSFERKSWTPPDVSFRVVCSKGTYIRTLVHDVGTMLGCGATLAALRRTRVGEWTVDQAWTIEDLIEEKANIARNASTAHGILVTP